MAGGILIVIAMLIVLPIAVMLGGAIWSAVMGFFLTDDAELHNADQPQ
jgi:hypothetical protein